jgi:hypothetical protein
MLELVEGPPDRNTFDRLFNEAWEKVSAERQRVGDRQLRESLWRVLHADKAYQYVLDGHVVGCGGYTDLYIGEEKWLWFRAPTLGCDANGSRSWFYSEDFQRISANKRRSEGYAGMIVVANTQSPAKAAVESIYGSYSGSYEAPVSAAADEVFGDQATDELRAATIFKIRLAAAS